MSLDFKSLIAGAELTPEQKKVAEELFGVESLTKVIEEAAMHSADEAFKADRATMTANWEKANTEYKEMQTKMANHEATATELAAAKKSLKETEDKLKAANPGIDLEKLKADLVTTIKGESQQLEFGARAFELEAIECSEQHRELFGARISVKDLCLEALAAKKSPLAYWEDKYKVPEKRATVAKEAHDKEILDATTAGYNRRIAEEANPATRQSSPSRDPFFVPKAGATDAINPWDEQNTPAEETKLLQELQAGRVQ